MTLREALRICRKPEHLRQTARIALAVGTILTAINQGDVILTGDATVGTAVKAALNYCVPFVVSNLGLLAGKRAELARKRADGVAPPNGQTSEKKFSPIRSSRR